MFFLLVDVTKTLQFKIYDFQSLTTQLFFTEKNKKVNDSYGDTLQKNII